MALMPGYKHTEVGAIPDDWEVKQIRDLRPFVTSGSRGWAAFYSDRGAPFIRITNLSRGSIYLCLEDLRLVDLPKDASEGMRTQLQDHDVLISITADIGIIGYVSSDLPKPAYINQHLALVRFDSLRTNPKFVSYFLASEKPQKLFRALTDSGAKAGMSLIAVQKIHLALPPTKAEQEAIAGVLSDADVLIDSIKQLIAKKRHTKQGAMQELLQPRDGWIDTTLGSVTERIVGGGTPSRRIPSYWGGAVPWMTVKDFASHSPLGTREYITREGLKNSASHLIPRGTLITSARMALGKAVVFDVDVSINQDLKAIFPRKDIDTRFLFYWFQFNEPRIAQMGSGSTVMGISLDDLKKISFSKPPRSEQVAIAAILTSMDSEIAGLESKLVKYRQLKQGMMHNLLTGKIRLVAPALAEVTPRPATREKSTARATESGSHTWAFNEAVIISVLSDQFGSPEFPLGRKRRTKLSYLFHRKTDQDVQRYLKKAAGPYNPKAKYAGPERIAQENGYVRNHQREAFKGLIAAENIQEAKNYFVKWYGLEITKWLEQFRHKTNDQLECLATVDMAVQELLKQSKRVDVNGVRALIASEPEWLPKLERSVFSDSGIAAAIAECHALFA